MEASTRYDLIVIGGGAAGFFGAVNAAEMKSGLKVLILEKTTKLLAKVKVSGGGRCNVTHACFDPVKLSHHYPRGKKQLSSIFKVHHARETVDWFRSKGVELKTEEDGRMFPVTDSSQTVIDCLMREALRLNVKIEMEEEVESIAKTGESFAIMSCRGKTYVAVRILIAAGGGPKREAYNWIAAMGHRIVPPIPSLFTFNDSGNNFKDLMGIAVPDAEVRIAGTKLSERGPILITHWGLSGPAVIKLSAWAAEHLHQIQYQFTALVNWLGDMQEENMRTFFSEHKKSKGKQKVVSNPLFALPQRLWFRVSELAEIPKDKIWAELPQRNLNKLIELLIRCPFQIKGKTTFKEEFVTCGGVDLQDIDPMTMESKKMPGVFFAGEVLNIDGETGGFNFQSAWSTAYLAARAITSPGPFHLTPEPLS